MSFFLYALTCSYSSIYTWETNWEDRIFAQRVKIRCLCSNDTVRGNTIRAFFGVFVSASLFFRPIFHFDTFISFRFCLPMSFRFLKQLFSHWFIYGHGIEYSKWMSINNIDEYFMRISTLFRWMNLSRSFQTACYSLWLLNKKENCKAKKNLWIQNELLASQLTWTQKHN